MSKKRKTAVRIYNNFEKILAEDVYSHGFLNPKEEVFLVRKAQEGSELARSRVIECRMCHVMSRVRELQREGDDTFDLFQSGIVGIQNAINHFPKNHQAFGPYVSI